MAASHVFSQSVAHQHHLYRLWNGQGYSMLRDAYYEDALTCFNQAIAIDPNQAESWYGRGEALANLGFYHEAFSCCNTALELKPNYSQAWALRAKMLFYLDQFAEALESCNQALNLHPQDAETWIVRGSTLQRLGQADAAYASYETALRFQHQSRLHNAVKQPMRVIWQLLSRTDRQSRFQVTGRQQKLVWPRDRFRQVKRSSGWQTSMTYSAGLVVILILLQLVQILYPTVNPFVQSQFHQTATLWIQTEAACRASGRKWQSGICWEQSQEPPL